MSTVRNGWDGEGMTKENQRWVVTGIFGLALGAIVGFIFSGGEMDELKAHTQVIDSITDYVYKLQVVGKLPNPQELEAELAKVK